MTSSNDATDNRDLRAGLVFERGRVVDTELLTSVLESVTTDRFMGRRARGGDSPNQI